MSTDSQKLLDTGSFLSTGWSEEVKSTFNTRDAILYALGVGAEQLEFTYENHEDFAVLPTIPFALCFRGNSNDVLTFPPPSSRIMKTIPANVASKGVDYRRKIEFFRPVPRPGSEGFCCVFRSRPRAVLVRRSGVIVEHETTMTHVDQVDDQKKFLVCRMFSATMLLGARATKSAGDSVFMSPVAFPSVPPDFSTEQVLHPSYTSHYFNAMRRSYTEQLMHDLIRH